MTYEEAIGFTGEQWNSLSECEKTEVLQSIENHMAFECGRINCPVEARFLHTGSDGVVLGTYDPSEWKIYINSSQFDAESMYGKDSQALVTACIHEGRHAYQHQVVDGIIDHDNVEEIRAWKENMAPGNYISFKENPRAYYNQPVEVDARQFSENRYQMLVKERQNIDYKDNASNRYACKTFIDQMQGETTFKTAAGYEINHDCGLKV